MSFHRIVLAALATLALVTSSSSAVDATPASQPNPAAQEKRLPLPDEKRSEKEGERCNVEVMPGVELVGSFAHDAGCRFKHIRVRKTRFKSPAAATAPAMRKLGWAKASPGRRKQLARMWTERVLARWHHFSVVHSAKGDFAKVFHKMLVSDAKGGVEIQFWRDVTRVGMLQPEFRNFQKTTIRFTKEGRLLDLENTQSFQEPF